MRLSEYLETIEDKNVHVYIGASSGWLFIGTIDEWKSLGSTISDKLLDSRRKKSERLDSELALLTSTSVRPIRNPQRYAHLLIVAAEKIYKTMNSAEAAKRMIYEFVPLHDREVIETYEKDALAPGIGVIVEGVENSRYWLRDEFEHDWILGDGGTVEEISEEGDDDGTDDE